MESMGTTLCAPKLCDPKWKEFSASLRNDTLFVKMSMEKARRLVQTLTYSIFQPSPTDPLLIFLREQLSIATNHSMFYSLSVEDAQKDIESLRTVEGEDCNGIIKQFRVCLADGLRDASQVDWIARMKGPVDN